MVENDRLIKACEYLITNKLAKNFVDIARVCGKSAQFFTDIKSKRMKPSLDFLDSFQENYNISKAWILTGEGQMLKVKEYNTHDPTSVLKDTNVGYITQPKEVEELKEKIRKLEDNCSTLIKSNLKLTETNTELIKENKELTTRLREMAKNVDAVSATMGKEELH